MLNLRLRKNIKELDIKINSLISEIESLTESDQFEDRMAKKEELEDMIKLRSLLSENKVKESLAPEIITGAFGIAGLMVVLKYEKTDVIVSKAFNMVPKLFRGV